LPKTIGKDDPLDIAARWRLVDNHAMIIFAEAEAIRNRILNLERLWRAKARTGLLPDIEKAGILSYVRKLALGESEKDKEAFYNKVGNLFDRKLRDDPEIHQFPERDFEDIIDLDDLLRKIHRELAICERAYWQRLERYEIFGKIPLMDSAVAEYGDIQQIYNAADFLCSSYYRNLTMKDPWTGLVIFGQYHEFRRRREAPMFFAPNYVKTCNYRMWNYFSHEVAHQVVEKLLKSSNKFRSLHEEVTAIVATTNRITRQVLPSYLATELMADILSTLVAGEEYILTLAELKYFPTIVLGKRKTNPLTPYIARSIRSPMILRVLLSCWVLRIAWGFAMKKSVRRQTPVREDAIFKHTIDKIIQEDNLVKEGVRTAILSEKRRYAKSRLKQCLRHLNAVSRESLYIVGEILRRGLIPQIKRFVKNDFYETLPKEFYFEYKSSYRGLRTRNLYHPSTEYLHRTSYAESIDSRREDRFGKLERIAEDLKDFNLVERDPRDVVAALSRLNREGKVTKIRPRSHCDHIAILTIALNDARRAERF